VHEQGDRLIRLETRFEGVLQDRARCSQQHAKALEEMTALAKATADSLEAHIVEHKVNAATLDRSSKAFVAVVAAGAVVLSAAIPKIVDWLF
jgi:hypothetical protein